MWVYITQFWLYNRIVKWEVAFTLFFVFNSVMVMGFHTLHICRCSDILFSEIPNIKRSSNSPSLSLWFLFFRNMMHSIGLHVDEKRTYTWLLGRWILFIKGLLYKSPFEHHLMTFSHSASQHLLQRACYETPVYQTRSKKITNLMVLRQVTV